MNTIILVISTIIIVTTHLVALVIFPHETKKTPVNKTQYQKISMQFAQVTPIKKSVKKIKEQKVVEKKPPVKTVKKIAKRKIQKIKPKKKIIQKKKMIKKEVKKTINKKVVPKKILKAPTKKVKHTAKKNKTQSLKRYKQVKQTYITKLRSQIDRNKKYPRISRKLKEQGKVTIAFRVLKSGEFTNIKIHTKSNRNRLNKAALDAVLLTQRFEKFPKELSKKEFLDITLPINFKLH